MTLSSYFSGRRRRCHHPGDGTHEASKQNNGTKKREEEEEETCSRTKVTRRAIREVLPTHTERDTEPEAILPLTSAALALPPPVRLDAWRLSCQTARVEYKKLRAFGKKQEVRAMCQEESRVHTHTPGMGFLSSSSSSSQNCV